MWLIVMKKSAVCILGLLATTIGLPSPTSAANPMPPLDLAERTPEQLVEAGAPVAAELTLPGGGGCSETLCLYTWTQTAAGKGNPNDVYFIRTKLDGEPLDRLGWVLNRGDGEYLGHFDSQVFWTGDAFVVFWRGAKGQLRSRRISNEGRLLENEPTNLGAGVASGGGQGLNFSAVQTERGFTLLWSAFGVAGTRSWHIQPLDRSGVPLASPSDLPSLGVGRVQAARAVLGSSQGLVLAVIGGEYERPTLVALTADGQVMKSTRVLPAGAASRYAAAALVPSAGGFWLLRVVHVQGQFTVFRIPVASDGSFDAAQESVVGSTVEGNLGWRVRLSMQGNTGLLLWIRGTNSQDPASLLGRRFDLTTGWIDSAAFAVSGVVQSALEDADVFQSSTHFISVWNDPVKTNTRSTCARSVPPTGDPGEPSCRIISLNEGFPIKPQVTASGRGYLIGWSAQERGYQGWGEKRFVRFSPAGVRIDESPFSLARGESWFSNAGPDQLVIGSYAGYGVMNLVTPPFAVRTVLPEGIRYQFGVWTGERHLLVGEDNGNLDHMGNALAGRFLRADGTLDERLAGFGNWRVESSNPILQPNVAIGSNGAQHLVVWVHGVPPGLLDVTSNELALLDRNGKVVEDFGFGERFGQQELNATACISPVAVAGDAQGFLIACGMQKDFAGTRKLKLLGYTPGSPPVVLGIFAPTGMNRPEIRVLRDGLHVFWSRENEIVQSFLRREGDGLSVVTDQHTFPFAPLDPQIAFADENRAALVYRRGPDEGAKLLFRLLDPNASAIDAGVSFVPDAAPPNSSPDAESIPAATLSPGDGCSCSTSRGARPAGSFLMLVVIGFVTWAKRRAFGGRGR